MISVPFPAATAGARQLLLPFANDRPGFEAFVPGRNREAFEYLLSLAGGASGVSLFLHGPSGSGKTHLLSAACARVIERGGCAAYMGLRSLPVGDLARPAWREGLDLLCIDDVQEVAGRLAWERGVMALYDGASDAGAALVLAGRGSPDSLGLTLPDLESRLAWGLVYPLEMLDDRDKQEALVLRAKGRGIDLQPEVAEYLLCRYPRAMTDLCRLLDRLDHGALVAQRRITVPFVRFLLENLRGGDL
ncbi:MAG: DnaA regulatory inactivator Hda [Gammaproteobacteria bacterium]